MSWRDVKCLRRSETFLIFMNHANERGACLDRKVVRPMLDSYIAQYGRRLYGLCRSLCSTREDADDLYQDTWLKVLKCLDLYDPSRPFEPWLTRICVNTYRSRLRRLARSPFLPFRTTEDLEAALQNVPAPEADDYRDVRAAVDKLPEKLRTVVILFYFEELDVAATAAALNIPPGTVKSRLHKARTILKEVLAHEADLPF